MFIFIYVISLPLLTFIFFYSDMVPSNIITYMNGVEKLGGTNFAKWKAGLKLILTIVDRDHSFREDKPIEPVAEGDNDTTLATRKTQYEKAKAQWERYDSVTLMIMDHTIDPAIRGALPKTPSSAKEFMAKIEEHFQGSSKANVIMLMTKMMNAKYMGQGSVREHIMKLIDMSNYLVHYIMLSLPTFIDNFKINYNGSVKKWKLA
jgi:hypothetical protein